jgi:hypothetical protein
MKFNLSVTIFLTGLLIANKSFGQFTTPPTITPNINTAATGGSVGIGTAAPATKLEVLGATNQLRLSYSSTIFSDIKTTALGHLVLFPNAGDATYQLSTKYLGVGLPLNANPKRTLDVNGCINQRNGHFIFDWAQGGVINYGGGGTGELLFRSLAVQGDINSYTDRMVIKSTGNVGIGTTTPNKLLTVNSAGANTQVAKFADNARYIGLGRDEIAAFDLAGNLANLYLGGGGKLTILNNGNVGIGTTTPGAKLEVAGQLKIVDGTQGIGKILTSDANGLASWTTPAGLLTGGTANYIPKWGTANSLSNSLLFDNGTNVGIGTNTPNKKLTVVGDVAFTSSALNAFEISNATTNTVNFRVTNTGIVYAREVNVQLAAFPDYVFAKNYKLTPLNEVEQYINTNHHLKGFEPATQYETNGMAVGEVVRLQQEKN